MDEGTLEAAIAAYGVQLQQVEAALSAGLDSSQQSDLLQLKDDLRQLIQLTEASLISVKKSRLLARLEEDAAAPGEAAPGEAAPGDAAEAAGQSNGDLDTEFAAFYGELGEGSGSSSDTRDKEGGSGGAYGEEEEEEEDQLGGTKVRAPYRTTWGTLEYHNAMVVGAEPPDGDEAQVRVLYIYPTQKSMKPCPFYLDDKCRFLDNCRFSHGEVVHVSELREFQEVDLSKLEDGSSCLVRHEDGVWHPARITDIDGGFYTVKFDSLLLKDAVVEGDAVIPPLREDDPISSDSEPDEAADGDAVGFAKVMDSAGASEATLNSSSFGGWEAHTRGIGSKLMLKMGYEYGKGLGKLQEGRVEPVMAVLLPKGKSLDECVQLTQRRSRSAAAAAAGSETGRRRRRRRPRVDTGGRQTVFDFLNNKLGGQRGAGGGGAAAAPLSGVEAYRGGKSAKRSLNVRLFQAAERVAHTQREIQTLSQTLARQTGRDASRVKQLEEKLSAARRLLEQQEAEELLIQREHRKADTHKNMTRF